MSGDYSAPPPKDADEKLLVSVWAVVMSGDYSAPPSKDADEKLLVSVWPWSCPVTIPLHRQRMPMKSYW